MVVRLRIRRKEDKMIGIIGLAAYLGMVAYAIKNV